MLVIWSRGVNHRFCLQLELLGQHAAILSHQGILRLVFDEKIIKNAVISILNVIF